MRPKDKRTPAERALTERISTSFNLADLEFLCAALGQNTKHVEAWVKMDRLRRKLQTRVAARKLASARVVVPVVSESSQVAANG